MPAKQTIIRDAVYSKIGIDLPNYVITDIDLGQTYFPQETLQDLGTKPYVKVIAMGIGSDRSRTLRDANIVLLSLAVQVAVQKRVDSSTDAARTAEIDILLNLVEEILDSCEDDELVSGEDYTWERTEPLKDENGLIYSYEQLFNQGVFNAIHTIFYQHIKQ